MKAATIATTLTLIAALIWALTADTKAPGGLNEKAEAYRTAVEDAANLSR